MPEAEINTRRRDWLQAAKRLALQFVERRSTIGDLCPMIPCTDRPAILKRLVQIGREIDQTISRMAEIESGNPPLGVAALLPTAGTEERTAVALLVLARLSPTANRELRQVGDISEHIAGDDPAVALAVRQLFSLNGSLRPFVGVERGGESNLDLFHVLLRDQYFAQVLGDTPDAEAQALGLLASDDTGRRTRRR